MDDHAVVVGINRYPAFQPPLQGSEGDANKFGDWLRSPDGGRVKPENVTTILGSAYPPAADPADAEPTCERVERALRKFVDQARRTGSRVGRRLYLYLAGHGFAPDTRDAALLMANAASGSMGYHIPGAGHTEWFKKTGVFEEIVLFMDCCRDNIETAPLRPAPWDRMTPIGGLKGYLAGFATKWSRKSKEEEFSDGWQGLFTRALLAGFKSGTNKSGDVTGSQLQGYVYQYLHELKGDDVQEPDFEVDPNHDVVLCTVPNPPLFDVKISLSSPVAVGQLEVRNKLLDTVESSPQATNAWRIKLRAGLYEIREAVVSGRNEHFTVAGALPEKVVEF